jgi:dolichol-phosphate mannosyltransferase
MHMRGLSVILTVLQAIAALRVFTRMARTASGSRIRAIEHRAEVSDRVSVLLPVLNEVDRVSPCLQGLTSQGPELAEIIVIDGGSTDGTCELVRRWQERDDRIVLVDAAPVPDGVNGKAYGLGKGLERVSSRARWVLTIDADVRPERNLVASLLAHARGEGVDAFSVATGQDLSGPAEGLVHPSMLTTLVYRFGIPGRATTNPADVQANGQCFLIRRDILDEVGGFAKVLHDVSEDVTLARLIAMRGHTVGFYESDDLVHVEMYASWRDAWDNWSRSLPMRDRFTARSSAMGLAEATLVQALPTWLAPNLLRTKGMRHPATMLNLGLVVARLGVLAGTSRAYRVVPWTYWLSPLADLPVVARIWAMWGRRTHVWRGRILVTGEDE